VIICAIGVVRLLNASNKMHSQREEHSRLQLLVKPVEGLLHFKGTTDPDDQHAWKYKHDELFATYRTLSPDRQKCDYDTQPDPMKVCDFDLRDLNICGPQNNYGIGNGSACVFLKFRPDSSWTPEFLNASDLPSNMPKDLKQSVEHSFVTRNIQRVAWVSCDGETPVDIENIGPVQYFPRRGFYYSEMSSEGTLIAVNFERPIKGVVISVECKLWAKNSDDSVSFKLLFD